MSVKYCTGVAAQWCPIHGEFSSHAEPVEDEFEDGGGI